MKKILYYIIHSFVGCHKEYIEEYEDYKKCTKCGREFINFNYFEC